MILQVPTLPDFYGDLCAKIPNSSFVSLWLSTSPWLGRETPPGSNRIDGRNIPSLEKDYRGNPFLRTYLDS